MYIYIYTQECSKALVVLLSFYWIKVSQLRFIFVFYIYVYIYMYIYIYIYIHVLLNAEEMWIAS